MNTLPLQPLNELVAGRGGIAAVLARLPSADERKSWKDRWNGWQRRQTIPDRTADEFCCRVLGVAPESVWVGQNETAA